MLIEFLINKKMIYGNEVSVWAGIIIRCYDSTKKIYPYYGGKGICVCDRWKRSFENFFEDMGPRPSKGHFLNRIDKNGDYEPSNCLWAKKKDQNSQIKEFTESESLKKGRACKLYEYDGRWQNLDDWGKELGIKPTTLKRRINDYGWSIERAFTQSVIPPTDRNPKGRPSHNKKGKARFRVFPRLNVD